jgi:hypothetical protein
MNGGGFVSPARNRTAEHDEPDTEPSIARAQANQIRPALQRP